MAILSDVDLIKLYDQIIPNPEERDLSLINPASIDIRVGREIICEAVVGEEYKLVTTRIDDNPQGVTIRPHEFILASTYERICVPNGYAMELKLKSSTARKGWNHSLAFWVDPGWDGILTMEIQNVTKFQYLTLKTGERFAQMIFHELTQPAAKPYNGRYNKATTVELAKPIKQY